MTTTFHYFTLEEVYQYAEKMGYSQEDIEITRICSEYDYDLDCEVAWDYEVSFGHEYTEMWFWTFEDLTQPAIDYDHLTWED